MASGLGKGNYEFKPVKLHLKIDLVSPHAYVKGLSMYIYLHIKKCKEFDMALRNSIPVQRNGLVVLYSAVLS